MSRKINAGQVVRDVRSGMHDSALMAKYNLSPGQLRALYGKLEAAGLLERLEVDRPKSDERPAEHVAFVCPACGIPQARFFEECPQCGVIMAKLTPHVGLHSEGSDSTTETADGLRVGTVYTGSDSRIILLSCVVAGLLLVVGVLAFFLWPRSSEPESLSGENRAVRTAPPPQGVNEPMKYIKNLPRVKEINPAVDAEMQRSFKDADSSLSKGRDQLERVLNDQ